MPEEEEQGVERETHPPVTQLRAVRVDTTRGSIFIAPAAAAAAVRNVMRTANPASILDHHRLLHLLSCVVYDPCAVSLSSRRSVALFVLFFRGMIQGVSICMYYCCVYLILRPSFLPGEHDRKRKGRFHRNATGQTDRQMDIQTKCSVWRQTTPREGMWR